MSTERGERRVYEFILSSKDGTNNNSFIANIHVPYHQDARTAPIDMLVCTTTTVEHFVMNSDDGPTTDLKGTCRLQIKEDKDDAERLSLLPQLLLEALDSDSDPTWKGLFVSDWVELPREIRDQTSPGVASESGLTKKYFKGGATLTIVRKEDKICSDNCVHKHGSEHHIPIHHQARFNPSVQRK